MSLIRLPRRIHVFTFFLIGLLLIVSGNNVTSISKEVSTTPIIKASNENSQDFHILFLMDEDYGGNVPHILSIFEDYGWQITTTALFQTIQGCSYLNYQEFTVDVLLTEINDLSDYNCLSILPGQSHSNLLSNDTALNLIKSAVNQNKIVTAWCKAVRVLARADILQGKRITGSDQYVSEYTAAGATFISQVPPIRDGNLITSVRSRFYRQETCDLIKETVEEQLFFQNVLVYGSIIGGGAVSTTLLLIFLKRKKKSKSLR